MYRFILATHIICGAFALISFWIAALGKKGTARHKLIGKIYMANMLVVTVSAVILAGYFYASGKFGIATFLAYLVLITVTAIVTALRAIKLKHDEQAFRNQNYRYLAWLNIVAGLSVFAIGIHLSQPILMGFCWVGVFVGAQMLRRIRRPLGHSRWWMKEHIGGILGCGIATHIAFLSIGLTRILSMFGLSLSGTASLLPWLAPVAVALIAGLWMERKYVQIPQRLAAQRQAKAKADPVLNVQATSSQAH